MTELSPGNHLECSSPLYDVINICYWYFRCGLLFRIIQFSQFINNKFGMLAGPGASLSVMGDNKLKGWIPKMVIMFKGICA